MAQVHRFRLEASYGPEELFAALHSICEGGANPLKFDFDWLKRRVAIAGPDRAAVEQAAAKLLEKVDRKAGNGLLLPGRITGGAGKPWELPIGVLLQTPDVYLEVMAAALAEQGLKGIRHDPDTAELAIPAGMTARALDYQGMIRDFPLPGYLRVVDLGLSEK